MQSSRVTISTPHNPAGSTESTSASYPRLESSDEPVPDGRAIILAVERDPHVRALEAYFLNEAGYAVEFADDGNQALEMARSLAPQIIITELLVPKLDGLALCRAIKSDPALRHIAVLVFSILAAETRAREAGADAFLLKPLADRRLVDTVRTLIATRLAATQEAQHRSARQNLSP
jgi:DNA-binding response OmpR family regulator